MLHVCRGVASAARSAGNDRHKRLLLALVAEEPTVGLDSQSDSSSYVASASGRSANWVAAQEDVDDDHRRAAMPTDELRGGSAR